MSKGETEEKESRSREGSKGGAREEEAREEDGGNMSGEDDVEESSTFDWRL